ncbi:MAG: hypothetical protein Q4F98_05935 [Lachnospiraceae bacterium]|nr:hypothetical protein [Lachnospiraceae bacterium]
MKKYWKRLVAVVLTIALVMGSIGCAKEEKEKKTPFFDASALSAGDNTSDWIAMALALSKNANEKAMHSYAKRLERYVVNMYEREGGLSKVKATEYHRIALTLLALGKDPRKIKAKGKKIDLVADGTWKFNGGDPGLQGANGLCYALILLEAGDYEAPENETFRKKLVEELLEYQKESGGFCIDNSLDPSVDMTAMAIQALAPYYEEEKCKAIELDPKEMKECIDVAMEWLQEKESEDAGFVTKDGESSEAISQVILAMCALGKNPKVDKTFTKGKTTLLTSLDTYRREDGMYMHDKADGEASDMATYQAMIALEAVEKLRTDKKCIFDFQ